MRFGVLILGWLFAVCLVASVPAQTLPDAPSAVRLASVESQSRPDVFAVPLGPHPMFATYVEPPADRPVRKTLDRNFALLGALTFGLTIVDVEMTQHCLHAGTCVELNPTLPHSHLGMYAANTPVNLAVMYWSYRRKAAGKRLWWMPPLVDIAAHAVGIGSNLRFLR